MGATCLTHILQKIENTVVRWPPSPVEPPPPTAIHRSHKTGFSSHQAISLPRSSLSRPTGDGILQIAISISHPAPLPLVTSGKQQRITSQPFSPTDAFVNLRQHPSPNRLKLSEDLALVSSIFKLQWEQMNEKLSTMNSFQISPTPPISSHQLVTNYKGEPPKPSSITTVAPVAEHPWPSVISR